MEVLSKMFGLSREKVEEIVNEQQVRIDRLVGVLQEVIPVKTLNKKLKDGYYAGDSVGDALIHIDP